MPRRVFVSYSHQQGDWVWDRLVPVLKAAKIGVLIDVERSKGGLALEWQIEEWQKAAEASLLVLTPDYLKSEYCLREMARALARDPSMKEEPARTIPLLREACPLPAEISDPGAFYLDLRSDGHDAPWKKLLDACEAELRPSAPAWLAARDECRTLLGRGASINLEVNDGTHWRELLAHLQSDGFNDLAIVDLH
ncbi:MAG: toll/interleukin-1 receptor domain-containing protein, partial [Acidobacteria bacterium]|nr:toll/interleukin-1 receptor domain-containing protein [Acidobacteriota bacterium]